MPFPFSHIIFQSGAVFVVGFFLIFYLENKFQGALAFQKPSPLFPLLGEEDSGIKFLSKTKSFPSLYETEELLKKGKISFTSISIKLFTNNY
ncbi:MAG TPA: hypothetical protein DF712_22240 [Balneola sp.]|jgi:hypothetical protein|nr:hypothetical protein [Bacteroidota bacterium]HCT55178.1 hypothetical protein [Balneola sp.]|tara:strand:- start:803 stop:1078 length:276 start_codon:yes stop_codon:yes gene_type:complete